MKRAWIYDHHNAVAECSKRGLGEWLSNVFAAPKITLKRGCTPSIRSHVDREFQHEGWALDVKIDPDFGLTVSALKGDMAFQLQTGNVSRALYDLLKLQYLFQATKIECAALAVPTSLASKKIGSNVANAERIASELKLFNRIITVPILLIAFE
jgi:hypothetical protein